MSLTLGLLALGLVGLLAVYIYLLWGLRYWKRRGIPGPEPQLFYGNLLEFDTPSKPLVLSTWRWAKQFGETYGYLEGNRRMLVTSNPEIIDGVFVKNFRSFTPRMFPSLAMSDPRQSNIFQAQGTQFKKLRANLSQILTMANIKKMYGTVQEAVDLFIRDLDEEADQGTFDVFRLIEEYTMDVNSRLATGETQSRQLRFLDVRKRLAAAPTQGPLYYLACALPPFQRLFQKVHHKLQELRKVEKLQLIGRIQKELALRITEKVENREVGEPLGENEKVDYIDLLLEIQGKAGMEENAGISMTKIQRYLSPLEMIGQCMSLILGGADTTASTFGVIVSLLARHPRVLQKLREEIETTCPDKVVSFGDLNNLTYADMIIKEATRLYPIAASAISRKCTADTTINGVTIEKGTFVMADCFGLHRNKQLWGDDADDFKPERFESEDIAHQQVEFMPFGIGQRMCPGVKIAHIEIKLALVHMLRRFDLVSKEPEGTDIKLRGQTVVSPTEVLVELRRRQHA